jgi:DNA polymerase delta subunit 1
VAGARYLVQAKDLVQERYSDVVKVVYGDTDSVFVKTVENLSVADAIKYLFDLHLANCRLGEKISNEVSSEFPDPVFLEFEKVMFPSMLVNRKVCHFPYVLMVAIRWTNVDVTYSIAWGDRRQGR